MERKKLLLSMIVVGMISSAALAVAPMGPPVATLSEGQYAVGLGYAYSDMTVEVSGPTSGTGDAELDNFTNNMYYGCLGYGISDTWNVCVALGAADAAFDADTGDDFDGDSQFGFAVQAKRTLHDNGSDTKWGTIFQYSTGQSEDKTTASSSSYANGHLDEVGPGTMELDWYEIQLALGPCIQVNEDVSLYGGPFIHLFEGDLRHKSSAVEEVELEQLWELGGYIGALINLGSNASLSAEFLFTGEAWGFGVGAMFPL